MYICVTKAGSFLNNVKMINSNDFKAAGYAESLSLGELLAPANCKAYLSLEAEYIKQNGGVMTFELIKPIMKAWNAGSMTGMFEAAEITLMEKYPELATV